MRRGALAWICGAATLAGALLLPLGASAQRVTALELRRELDKVDADVGGLTARQTAIEMLRSALQTTSDRLSKVDVADVTVAVAKLIKEVDAYEKAVDAGEELPAPGSSKDRSRTQQLVKLWDPIAPALVALQQEVEREEFKFAEALRPIFAIRRVEDNTSLASEIFDTLDREFRTLNRPLNELRQFQRNAESMDALRAIKNSVLPSLQKTLPTLKTNLLTAVAALRSRVESEHAASAKALATQVERQKTLVKEAGAREEGQQRTDAALLTYALPSFGLLLIALLTIPKLYVLESQLSIFRSGLLLELITVFLLTTSILLLGIAGKLNSEVLGTLIGGISGYVLGRWRKTDEEVPPSSRGKPTDGLHPAPLLSPRSSLDATKL